LYCKVFSDNESSEKITRIICSLSVEFAKDQVAAASFSSSESFTISFEGFKDFYILMRETMEMGEKIEDTLHRGLMEEFGITGDIITYLGSIKSEYPVKSSEPYYSIEKTTLYFLVRTKTFKPELRGQDDAEKESEIQWQPIDFLISKMPEQGRKYSSSLDESSVLEKAKKYIS